MLRSTRIVTLTFAACCAHAAPALAHVCMDKPVSRVGPSCSFSSPQKPGPCGINTRSTQYVTTFKPGETITVELNETIDHPSHYRIAFNTNGDEFEDPTSKEDTKGNHPFVLLDGIMDMSAAKQSVQVTLPNMTCDNCTLQLIQVMYDKGGNGFGNDDIYYSCADLVLKGTPAANPDAGSPGDAGTKSDASAGDPTRPAPDAGGAGAPPVDLGGGAMLADAGSGAPAPHDAGHGPLMQADGGSAGATGGGGTTGGSLPESGIPIDGIGEEEDSGSCAVDMGRARDATQLPRILLGIGLAALLVRRRRAG